MDSLLQNYIPPTSKISETICEICDDNASKYRCPRCELATCSLTCSKSHKLRDNCSGKRNTAAYVARSNFNETTLSSDINFLEDAARFTGLAKTHLRSVDPMVHKAVLVEEANHRMVDLRLLAEWFPKRTENRTCFRGRTMFWTVKWILDISDHEKPIEILIHGAKEHKQVRELFRSLLVDPSLETRQKEQLALRVGDRKPDAFNFFLQLDPSLRHRCPLSFSIAPGMRLHGCLVRKIIVEYPTILVRPKPSVAIEGKNTEKVTVSEAMVIPDSHNDSIPSGSCLSQDVMENG